MATRWGKQVPRDSDQARERLLDAAAACIERFGIAKTTMDDVADAADVSRATVYRYFAGRDELTLGVLTRNLDVLLSKLEIVYAEQPTFTDAMVEGLVATSRGIIRDPNLSLLFAPDSAAAAVSIMGASQALLEAITDFLRPHLERWRAEGELRADISTEETAEWLLHAMLAILQSSNGGPQRESGLRHVMRTFVMPGLLAWPPQPGAATVRTSERTKSAGRARRPPAERLSSARSLDKMRSDAQA